MAQDFDYYYGSQADQFSFIRIPRVMLTGDTFSTLSIHSKVLYGVLLDRMSLSRKNAWFDEENRVFIIYPIGEIQEDLGFSKKKAMELLSELEKFGLLVKKRRGHGLPNILYVKSFMTGAGSSQISARPLGKTKVMSRGEGMETSDRSFSDSRTPMHGTSRSDDLKTLEVMDSVLQDVPVPTPEEVPNLGHLKNYTEFNQTDMSHIESNHICRTADNTRRRNGGQDDEMRFGEMRAGSDKSSIAADYRSLICENIEYDNLLLTFPNRTELLEGIVDLILETVLCSSEEILIASSYFPTEIVKSKFLKLNYGHIRYVVQCLQANTTKVWNIKKYLMAALFNAPSTIESYYTAEVNHDMYGIAVAK